jgi:Peptidase C13 family/YcxB-like protein
MVIDLHLTQSDWIALQQVLIQGARARVGSPRLVMASATPILTVALLVSLQAGSQIVTASLSMAAGVLAMIGAMLWANRLLGCQLAPDADGEVLGARRMELGPEGMRTVRKASVSLTQWSALKGITRTDTHIFLWIDRISAHIVPLRDVPAGADALLETIEGFAGTLPCLRVDSGGRHSSATEDARAAIKATGGLDAVSRAPGFLSTFARRLTWRAVDPGETSVGSSDAMIFACASMALAVWLAYDRYAGGPNATWYPGGATSVAWYAIWTLAFAWALQRVSLEHAPFRTLLAPLVACLPLLLAFGVAIRLWAPEPARVAGYALLALAVIWYLTRRLSLSGAQAFGPLAAATFFVALFAVATTRVHVYPHFWFAADGDEDRVDHGADAERLLFAQADRIDAAAAAMLPERAHRPDVFFVGFAGVAEQKVFAEELKLSERVVTQRYGAAGRSLLLVNDDRDHVRWPIATVSGLRRALERVGARMNREEDVLFLMLTSHGSDAPLLSVSNGDWPLEQLDGHALRAALDESGIRWRVIVISACHSGAFIAPLADDRTIVLTAAAKERTSFGCSDTADLTYFGQALMRDALPGAESLEDAFERAKHIITEREKRENLDASEPQGYFGTAIRAYWKRVEATKPRAGDGEASAAP